MSKRRAGRRGKVKDTPPHIEVAAVPRDVNMIQVHQTLSKCYSTWDDTKGSETVIVPHAININIFPRYAK